MGEDFTALIRYKFSDEQVQNGIALLEQNGPPAAIKAVKQTWIEVGFFNFDDKPHMWATPHPLEENLPAPILPTVKVSRYIGQGFYLTFGEDTLGVLHLLRWSVFLTVPKWQHIMIEAIAKFAEVFDGSEALIIGEYSASWGGFLYENKRFKEILQIANTTDGGQVANIKDMFRTVEYQGDMAMKPTGEIVKWPQDKILPNGWQRPTIWESEGYWRVDFLGNT